MLSKNGHKPPLAATSSAHLHPAQSSAFAVLSMAHRHCPARYCPYQYRQYCRCSSLSRSISPPLPYSRPGGSNHFNCIFHDFLCISVVSSYWAGIQSSIYLGYLLHSIQFSQLISPSLSRSVVELLIEIGNSKNWNAYYHPHTLIS